MTAATGCHSCGGGAGRHDEAAHTDWPAEVDPCAMPTGFGHTCLLPGDHDDGCQPEPARCRCTHTAARHGTDRHGRAMCFGSSVCGCATYRPQETK